MSLQNQNIIKLSLYKIKIANGSSLDNNDNNLISNQTIKDIGVYKIKISFNNQESETEKIQSNEIEYGGGKCFYFGIPQNNNEDIPLEISAIGTSWMLFNSPLCSISIPYLTNLGNFNDQKQWYHLKNTKDEIVISIFASIWCEYSLCNYDTFLNNLNVSVINKTFNNINNINHTILNEVSKIEIVNTLNNTVTNNIVHHLYNIQSGSCDYNNSTMINDTSNLNFNLNNSVFPFNEKSNLSMIGNIATSEDGKEIATLLEEFIKKNEKNYDKETYDNLMSQIKTLIEKEESVKEQQKKNKENIEQLKEMEAGIFKEKAKLEGEIRTFKKQRAQLEKKFKESNLIFSNEQIKHLNQKEIYENNKQLFYSLNYYLQTGEDLQSENCLNIKKEDNNDIEKLGEKRKSSELGLETDRKKKSIKRKTHPNCEKENFIKNNENIAKTEINLNNYQTPKNEKINENKVLIDSLETVNQMKQNKNKIIGKNGKDTKKGKVNKRNENDNLISALKSKNKVNISASIGQTFTNHSKKNISNSKNSMNFHQTKRELSQNNNNSSNSKVMSSHKIFQSRKNFK